jgi:hypothetical protein
MKIRVQKANWHAGKDVSRNVTKETGLKRKGTQGKKNLGD